MAELCSLVHRFASTSTAIVSTVRLAARSSVPHGGYKRCKSDKRPHHGAVPLQAQPRPSTCTRPGRSNHLKRSYTLLTPPGHLDVPKHSPPLNTRKAAAKRTCTQNEMQQWQTHSTMTFSYIKHERSVRISPVFKPNRRHNEPQRQIMWPFSCERASKRTRERSYTASIDTRRATPPTK